MFSAILLTFLHVSVDQILGDVFVDIKGVFLDIFPRFLVHHKKHGFLIVRPEEEDLLVIAADEVAYKVRPLVADSSTSSDSIIPEAPPSPGSLQPARAPSPAPSPRRPISPPPPPQQPHPEAGPSRASPWRNMDLSSWDFPETPFKRVYDELDEL
jgi:hypothetical protein